jgi:N-acetylglucosamine-6-sulfatase
MPTVDACTAVRGRTRREVLSNVATGVGLMPALATAASAQRATRKPNVLFLLTDDLDYRSFGPEKREFLRLPNLDRIANEGAVARNCFVTTSLCAPSRASFLTGRYAHSHGIYSLSQRWNQSLETWPRVLQRNGWRTAHIGKFHMDSDDRVQPGYDYWAAQSGQGEYRNPRKNMNGAWVDLLGYDTDIITNQALEFMSRRRDSPFCVWLAYKAPHAPFTPAPGHEADFSNVAFPVHPDFLADDAGKPARVRKSRFQISDNVPNGSYWPLERWTERQRSYFRSLMGVEDSAGKLLRFLDENNLADDTVVVVTSDNGFFHGEHGLRSKMEAYEESIRIPFAIRYPRAVRPGTRLNQMLLNIDVPPTLLDICGVPAPSGMQGRSWKSAATGADPALQLRGQFLYEFLGMGKEAHPERPVLKALRNDTYKFIANLFPRDIDELYDVRTDPRERTNLAANDRYRGIVADMKRRLVAEMSRLGDPALPAVQRMLGSNL